MLNIYYEMFFIIFSKLNVSWCEIKFKSLWELLIWLKGSLHHGNWKNFTNSEIYFPIEIIKDSSHKSKKLQNINVFI